MPITFKLQKIKNKEQNILKEARGISKERKTLPIEK